MHLLGSAQSGSLLLKHYPLRVTLSLATPENHMRPAQCNEKDIGQSVQKMAQAMRTTWLLHNSARLSSYRQLASRRLYLQGICQVRV